MSADVRLRAVGPRRRVRDRAWAPDSHLPTAGWSPDPWSGDGRHAVLARRPRRGASEAGVGVDRGGRRACAPGPFAPRGDPPIARRSRRRARDALPLARRGRLRVGGAGRGLLRRDGERERPAGDGAATRCGRVGASSAGGGAFWSFAGDLGGALRPRRRGARGIRRARPMLSRHAAATLTTPLGGGPSCSYERYRGAWLALRGRGRWFARRAEGSPTDKRRLSEEGCSRRATRAPYAVATGSGNAHNAAGARSLARL